MLQSLTSFVFLASVLIVSNVASARAFSAEDQRRSFIVSYGDKNDHNFVHTLSIVNGQGTTWIDDVRAPQEPQQDVHKVMFIRSYGSKVQTPWGVEQRVHRIYGYADGVTRIEVIFVRGPGAEETITYAREVPLPGSFTTAE